MNKILISIFCLTSFLGFSKTVKVPQDFSTIQSGIDNAVNGDTVLLAIGTYSGTGNYNIDFHGKKIVLKSTSGKEQTIIDINNLGRGFYFHTNEDSLSVIDGITIMNGTTSDSNGGGGIYCLWSGPKIINSTIHNSTAVNGGGGISLMNSSMVIRNCLIKFNNAYGGGGIYMYGSSPLISNSVISSNTASSFAGGIGIMNYSNPKISLCIIENNVGEGFYIYYGSVPSITNSKIINNSGNGVSVTNFSVLTMENCVVASNSKIGIWGSLLTNNNLYVTNCDVIFNKGGGLYSQNTHFIVTNSIIYGNDGDEIFLWNLPLPDISYSIIQGKDSGGIVGNVNWSGLNYDVYPQFVDALSSNYNIIDSSPCINAGDPNFKERVNKDLAGRVRIFNNRVDIGAYESNRNYKPTLVSKLGSVKLNENFNVRDLSLKNHFNDDGDWTNLKYSFTVKEKLLNTTLKGDSILELSSKSCLYGLDTIITKVTDNYGLFVYDTLFIEILQTNQNPISVAKLGSIDLKENFGKIDIQLKNYFADDDGFNNISFSLNDRHNLLKAQLKIGSTGVIELSSIDDSFGLDTLIIKATDLCGLTVSDKLFVKIDKPILVTSVNLSDPFSVEIFPNPVISTLFLKLDKSDHYSVEIMDSKGIRIRNINTTDVELLEMDVSGLTSSIYFIQVYVSGRSRTFKFVKK